MVLWSTVVSLEKTGKHAGCAEETETPVSVLFSGSGVVDWRHCTGYGISQRWDRGGGCRCAVDLSVCVYQCL